MILNLIRKSLSGLSFSYAFFYVFLIGNIFIGLISVICRNWIKSEVSFHVWPFIALAYLAASLLIIYALNPTKYVRGFIIGYSVVSLIWFIFMSDVTPLQTVGRYIALFVIRI
jgi:hypothetical protein